MIKIVEKFQLIFIEYNIYSIIFELYLESV